MNPNGKLRVVFNASFPTSTGASLNDVLLAGPEMQPDLWLILSRWRLHHYAFRTDIIKMFRQIRIHPDDADLQRILWRTDPSARVKDYRLTTVTYGTAPASYLAIRVLFQLADDGDQAFPLGAETLRRQTYVDDNLAGAATLGQALRVRDETVKLLESAGLELSKWAANHKELAP